VKGMMGPFWLLLIGLAYLIYLNVDKKNMGAGESPLEIVKKRYARGQITHEQFEEIKKDIL
jgi:putative membrane protein